ncbi:hypothetical protein ACFW04_007409 [Cataglyphis niger]
MRLDGNNRINISLLYFIEKFWELESIYERRFFEKELKCEKFENILNLQFQRDKILYESYSEFIKEYLDLDHMSLVAILLIKEMSSTTKFRMVFDASNKTDSGLSLNDVLCVRLTLRLG